MKTRLAAIALIVVGLGAIVLSVVGWPSLGGSPASKYITSTVGIGTVSAQSVANGTIGSSTVYGIKFGLAPDVVSSAATTAGSSGAGSSSFDHMAGQDRVRDHRPDRQEGRRPGHGG